jgi:hypothetical protein
VFRVSDPNAELREENQLLPPIQWARLWLAGVVLMMAHSVGWTLGYFDVDGPTWWIAFAAIFLLGTVQTIEYVRMRWSV